MSLDRYRRLRLIVLPPSANAYEAARAMAEHHLESILVGEDRSVIGVVTARDLMLEVLANALDPRGLRLDDVMSGDVATLDVGASPADAARLMAERVCRRIPLTEDGIPVGVVTLDDLVLDGAIDLDAVRAVVAGQLEDAGPVSERSAADTRVRVRMRRRARAERSFHRLIRAVSRSSGIADAAVCERALGVVLGALCRRLTPDGARHFVAQLPSKLHAELTECFDGPDKRICLTTIETELARELGATQASATDVLYAVCAAVADGVSAGEIEAVRGQLPGPMKDLFPPLPYRRAG